MQPIISLEIKGTSGRGVRGAGRGYMDTVFSSTPFLKQYQDLCFSKNNLARIKDGGYAIKLDDKKSKGTPQVSLYIDRNTALYFDSLELNIFFKKYFYPIAFTEYILAGTILLDYANIFSWNEYKKNNKIIRQI